jgi:hypothetical protein
MDSKRVSIRRRCRLGFYDSNRLVLFQLIGIVSNELEQLMNSRCCFAQVTLIVDQLDAKQQLFKEILGLHGPLLFWCVVVLANAIKAAMERSGGMCGLAEITHATVDRWCCSR